VSSSDAPNLVPSIPDSAPFSPAQRAWLNGFLAGLISVSKSPASNAPVATPLSVPVEEESFPWHDSALAMDERMKLAEGKPPARQLMAAMAQLDCGSCGYLCQTYAEAIASGADKDLTKCSPGGKDTAKKLKELVATITIGATTNGTPSANSPGAPKATSSPVGVATSVATAPAPTTATRDHPATAHLLRNLALNSEGSAKDTRHIEIDLRGTSVTYKAGDALGICPENDPQLVDAILNHLSATGAEDVTAPDGSHTSLRQALRWQRVITSPTESLIELLISTCSNDAESQALQTMLVDEGSHPFSGLHVLDVLQLARSATVSPQQLVDSLGKLAPRLYSISSSPLAHAGQVHLTVGAVRYTNGAGRTCGGVGSTYLADRVRAGEPVRVFVHVSKHFGLPSDPSVPIIMVGPGTGIAPFRAFLHERKAQRAPGKSWLFFGDQKSSHDFLYRSELESMLSEGSLSRLDTAFSRDQADKVYVQDRMRHHAAELWQWLSAGAHFYICGDAKRMARDVETALIDIITQHGNTDAKAYLKQMTSTGRYQKDVY
jgi:sulfite reductase (NADPH) flavoprotein alpha-component